VDEWRAVSLLAPLPEGRQRAVAWDEAETLAELPELLASPEVSAGFEELPPSVLAPKAADAWRKALASYLHRTRRLVLWKCAEPRAISRPDETEGDFRARLAQLDREARDLRVEKLRKAHGPKLERLQERLRKAEERVEREAEQYGHQKLSAAVSVGATILGALFGRKTLSVGNVGRAGTAVRGASRAAREKEDVARAKEGVEDLKGQLQALEDAFRADLDELDDPADPAGFDLSELEVPARKSDVEVSRLALVWTPWRVAPTGIAEAAW
jgi:hypothetical protein